MRPIRARFQDEISRLNLLVALDILLEEQSVAAAARRLDLSAPAMSRTPCARIHATVGDPILVRAGRKLVPTTRALELQALVRKTSESAIGLLQPSSVETMETLERQFTIRPTTSSSAYAGRLLTALRGPRAQGDVAPACGNRPG